MDVDATVGETDRVGELCSVLAKEHCRHVLHYFHESEDNTATVDELVEHLVKQDGCSDDREQVALHIHHATLPKLVEADVIEHDQYSKYVRYHPNPHLERLWNLIFEREGTTQ